MAKSIKQQAREILEASIDDIKAGRWVCNTLTQACPVEQKGVGCALGLVGINGDALEKGLYTDDADLYGYGPGTIVVTYKESYPNEKWPKPALKAVSALAQTTRLRKNRIEDITADATETADLDPKIVVNSSLVFNYNDSGISKRAALNWFKRALEHLS